MMRKSVCMAAGCAAVMFLLSGCGVSFHLSFGETSQNRPDGSSPFGNASYWEESAGYDSSLDNTSYLDSLEKEFVTYPSSAKNRLSEEEEELYRRIVSRIENNQYPFTFENIANETFKAAYFAVLADHPEYFWLGHNYTYTLHTQGDETKITVEPSLFSEDTETVQQAKRALDKVVQTIVTGAERQTNLYEKVKYVHDYIVDHTVYDKAALSDINAGSSDGTLQATSAYGCLVEQKAICSGYAAAFQLVMQKLGIECGRVSGMRMGENVSHQWNFVSLDEEYYYVDTTWDDPVRADGVQTRTYEYFLINETDLAYTHTKDEDSYSPVCNGTKYNFYVYNGLYFDEYDFGLISMAADKTAADRIVTVKFASPDILMEAQTDLIDNQRIFDIDYIDGRISYSVSSSGCILTISW